MISYSCKEKKLILNSLKTVKLKEQDIPYIILYNTDFQKIFRTS